ncbi:hypothetical protein AURDEDRAFT_175224 [Auricularia subglabra TFB-10046 SS5]|nr:hypothetical protein AURDEDRAFT_175224 [Auricularia subglabra TFB-10046 SS5]
MFLIAHVQGRYRCIAVFHSQWLYGRLVVNAAARLMRGFTNPINAAAIASELATLEELDIDVIVDEDNQDDENPAILCPYLIGLFLTCSRVNMEFRRIYRMNLERMFLEPLQCHNDDGFTFFDLTEPSTPRYCFWWPRTAPLTAFQYLERYEDEKDLPIDIPSFGLLGHFPLLDVATLAEVWPGEFGEQLPSTPPPCSPLVRSAMSTIGGIRATNPDVNSPIVAATLLGLLHAMHVDSARPRDGGAPSGPDTHREPVLPEANSPDSDFLSAYPDAFPGGYWDASSVSGLFGDPSTSSALASLHARLNEAGEMFLAHMSQDDCRDADSVLYHPSEAAATCSSPQGALSPLVSMFAIMFVLFADDKLHVDSISFIVERFVTRPGRLQLLRRALLRLKPDGFSGTAITLLKELLIVEKSSVVDLRHWLSNGVLDASQLLDFADALSHAEYLDLSFSSTLTAEIVETLVPRLPKLRHLIALSCRSLGPLTTVLPLTTYLASLPLLDAVDQSRLKERYSTTAPECLRWVEESDPPAGLSVVIICPSLFPHSNSTATRRYGVELTHFGAEGVVYGFARLVQRLYDPDYQVTESGVYFGMRGYFHATCSASLNAGVPTYLDFTRPGTFAHGCLPSLIRDIEPEDGRAYPQMEATTASGGLTKVPRYPGWVLVLDTKGTMPFHTNPPKDTVPFGAKMAFYVDLVTNLVAQLQANARAEGRPESDVPTLEHFMSQCTPERFAPPPPPPPPPTNTRPEYAFERWDVVPDGDTKELQPVERVSLREWAGRLHAGHGPVPDEVLDFCESVLAMDNVVLRGSTPEPAPTH